LPQILLLGTFHEIQEKDFENTGEFRRTLLYLTKRYGVSTVMEEWTTIKGETVGSRLAREFQLEWKNVGTPPTEELKTGGVLFDPIEQPPMVIDSYGPVDVQTYREHQMVDEVQRTMSGRKVGLMICGLAHLQSLCAN
jgi:hypothetical protein